MLDQAASFLFTQGVLGVWAALATAGMIWAVLGWMKEKEARLQDNRDYGKITAETEEKHFVAIDNFKKTIDAAVTVVLDRTKRK